MIGSKYSSAVAAGLLQSLCYVTALPRQIALDTPSTHYDLRAQCDAHSPDGADLPMYNEQTLRKRSPDPSPADNEATFSSRAAKPFTARILHEYQISQEKQIVEPQEYLKLMDKAANSGTNGVLSYNEGVPWILRGNAFKWLDRAEASVLRTQGLLDGTRKYYVDKIAERVKGKDRRRAKMKKGAWQLLLHYPRYEQLVEMVNHPDRLYQRDIDGVQRRIRGLSMKDSSEDQNRMAIASKEMQEARDALAAWTSPTTTYDEALIYLNKELNNFAEASNYCGWLQHGQDHLETFVPANDEKIAKLKLEMEEYATKALAWNVKAKELE